MTLLEQVKDCLRRGVKIFEEFESRTLDQGVWRLIAELQRVPVAFETYYHEMQSVFSMIGGRLEDTPCGVVPISGEEAIIHYADKYWSFEEHPGKHICYLRRTPTPVANLDDLTMSNNRLIAFLGELHPEEGIVVDMREAPQRNDVEFENAMAHLRQVLSQTSHRITVLLETTTGLLQVNRIGRNDGSEIFATTNEYAAVKYASTRHEPPQISA